MNLTDNKNGFSHIETVLVALVVIALIGVGGYVYNRNHHSHAEPSQGWTTLVLPYKGTGGISAIACTTNNNQILATMFFIIINTNKNLRTTLVEDESPYGVSVFQPATYSSWNDNVQTISRLWSPSKGWYVLLAEQHAPGGVNYNFRPEWYALDLLNGNDISVCPPGISF